MKAEKQLLQSYLNRDSKNRDIYHDLMSFKVREILLVSNLYDAFFIDQEGRFSEIMLYDYGNFNLTSIPRITGVTSQKEALEQLESKSFDLVIVMVGFNRATPAKISQAIKKQCPDIPIFVLLNNNVHVKYFRHRKRKNFYDKIFVWNADSRVFFAMIKYLEDKKNALSDAAIASVRIILLVEDSPVYYSAFLTHLYKIIFHQTNEIINEVSTDSLYKVLKLRARPKVLLASNYEEALELFDRYKEYIFCLITDVQYEKNGKMRKNAGFELVKEINTIKRDLPVIVLSEDREVVEKGKKTDITFIDKNSQNLYKKLKYEVSQKVGFGPFVFRNKNGEIIGSAMTMKDFEKEIKTLDDESIIYHSEKDQFSHWLMARTEIQLAKILFSKKASEFKNADEVRTYLMEAIRQYRDEKPTGKIVPFSEAACDNADNIITLRGGAFGGKGRGLAFVNSLKYSSRWEKNIAGLTIKTPKTAIIGANEFEEFMENNNFVQFRENPPAYQTIKRLFLKASLSEKLIRHLDVFLEKNKKPLAVRSSGLFEDSISQPFAGIFETYITPNNHPDRAVRLRQVMDAIKLVFASVFSEIAINYKHSLDQKIGDESMAIVLQELVGHEHEGCYYPHISGVAQSYNYYPFADMRPQDGFAVAAFGLGSYVVEGEVAYRFSPKYPDIQFLSTEDQVKFTQTYFYALDMTRKDIDFLEGSMAGIQKVMIYEARAHNTLKHCVSEYDPNNDAIYAGLTGRGPIIVNFSPILKHHYIPLAKAIKKILDSLKHAFDTPVEIEFAVDLNKDGKGNASFYILQVKPLLMPVEDYNFNIEELPKEDIILYSDKGMGNGIIDYLKDVIYVKNEKFETVKTEEMAKEIDKLNHLMKKKKQKYILIGPGRWGTRDRFIGIPVNWTQISHAKVIVETSLDNHSFDASYGSHFFHNLTTMDIAYLSVFEDQGDSFINYEILQSAKLIEETEFFRHVRFSKPVEVKIDGRKRVAAIIRK